MHRHRKDIAMAMKSNEEQNPSSEPNLTEGQSPSSETASTESLVSITSWLINDAMQDARPLSVLRLSTEPVYVSLFTDQGCNVETHFLKADDDRAGGYVHCLGQD